MSACSFAAARLKNSRPALDPLFRSAAVTFGPRALGVVLSGFVSEDGVSGLQAIKRCGGATIVQDPEDAEFEGLPEQAIAFDSPDHVAPAAEMPALLCKWIAQPKPPAPDVPPEIVLAVHVRRAAPLATQCSAGFNRERSPLPQEVFDVSAICGVIR